MVGRESFDPFDPSVLEETYRRYLPSTATGSADVPGAVPKSVQPPGIYPVKFFQRGRWTTVLQKSRPFLHGRIRLAL